MFAIWEQLSINKEYQKLNFIEIYRTAIQNKEQKTPEPKKDRKWKQGNEEVKKASNSSPDSIVNSLGGLNIKK